MPKEIVKLRNELTAQYEAKNAQAKKEYYAAEKRAAQAEDLKRKKRKREEGELTAELHMTTSKKAKSKKVRQPIFSITKTSAHTAR